MAVRRVSSSLPPLPPLLVLLAAVTAIVATQGSSQASNASLDTESVSVAYAEDLLDEADDFERELEEEFGVFPEGSTNVPALTRVEQLSRRQAAASAPASPATALPVPVPAPLPAQPPALSPSPSPIPFFTKAELGAFLQGRLDLDALFEHALRRRRVVAVGGR